MDPNAEKPVETPQAPAQPTAMDVVAPPPAQKTDNQQDVPQSTADPKQQTEQPKAEAKQPTQKPPKPPKKPGNGVGLAITATVIVILGLSAMATFAYLQTQ